MRPHAPLALVTALTLGVLTAPARPDTDSLPPRAHRVLALRDALNRDPAANVSAFFAPDSRTWFESRTGAGEPRDASGHDAWADWDRYFHAVKSLQFVSAGGDSAVFHLTESNDWYRLVDRAPSATELTYWFDGEDRITGTLVRGLPQDPGAHGRLAEFKAWDFAHDPRTLAYLLPDGKLVPDLARAKRWKQALTAWRREAGLPAVR
jgi:hypothetical protein